MKQIRKVLKQLRHNTSQKLNTKTKEYEFCYTVERAEKEIREIILKWIGKDKKGFTAENHIKAEIRKKVEGEL